MRRRRIRARSAPGDDARGVRNLPGFRGEAALSTWLYQIATEPCAELARELSAFAAAEIVQAARAQIEAHLATCTKCAGACDALKRTVSLCKRLLGDAVPDRVRERVRAAIAKAIGA